MRQYVDIRRKVNAGKRGKKRENPEIYNIPIIISYCIMEDTNFASFISF